MKKRAMTLMEVLIASVLMVLIVSGLVGVFLSGKKFSMHSRSRIAALELTRVFVDPLQNQVEESGLLTNCLGTGSCDSLNTTTLIPPINYTSSVNITGVSGTSLRRALVTINWTEPQ